MVADETQGPGGPCRQPWRTGEESGTHLDLRLQKLVADHGEHLDEHRYLLNGERDGIASMLVVDPLDDADLVPLVAGVDFKVSHAKDHANLNKSPTRPGDAEDRPAKGKPAPTQHPGARRGQLHSELPSSLSFSGARCVRSAPEIHLSHDHVSASRRFRYSVGLNTTVTSNSPCGPSSPAGLLRHASGMNAHRVSTHPFMPSGGLSATTNASS